MSGCARCHRLCRSARPVSAAIETRAAGPVKTAIGAPRRSASHAPHSTDDQGLARDNKAGAGGKAQHKAWLACLERCCNGADRERMVAQNRDLVSGLGVLCITTGRDNTDQRLSERCAMTDKITFTLDGEEVVAGFGRSYDLGGCAWPWFSYSTFVS